jgi:dTDP-4-amino-4,6-dideoxygalactose transaminase
MRGCSDAAACEDWGVIPFIDLRAQYREIQDEVKDAVARVLEEGAYVLGSEVESFESEFAAYCGAAHGVAVNSGTSALHLALLAAGAGPGDQVITVPFTFIATAAVIRYVGATPVFVDIDPVSYTLDPTQLEAVITPRTRALIPVHLYGHPADMDPILAIARSRGLAVIEDAAQAHGSAYKGRPAGGLGDFGCFSFYPTKNLGACGEGGMVLARDPEGARRVRSLRDWGQTGKYHHEMLGFNYRMDWIQGAILRVKLRRLERWTEMRRAHAARYDKELADSGVSTPVEMPWARHVYHAYTVRSARRDALRAALADRGIQSAVHYPVPVHQQPIFADLGFGPGAFPNAEAAADEVLCLPVFPELPADAPERVAACIREARSEA